MIGLTKSLNKLVTTQSLRRNVGPDTPLEIARNLNALWTQGGILYAPPFR